MIQVYSDNVTVAVNSTFPLNNVVLEKGCTADLIGNSIRLNRVGIYEINVDAALEPTTAGLVSVQLLENDALVSKGQSEFTGAVDTTGTLSFTALVQCPQNNTCCCNTSPTVLSLVNVGETEVTGRINVVVTKLC